MSRVKIAALLIALALGSGTWLIFTSSGRKLCCSSVYKTFTSPDQRFQIKVFQTGWPWPVLPGSAGDAPGFLRLQTHDGKTLHEQDVEAVQLVDQIHWEPRRVEIKLIADWELPETVVAQPMAPEK
ncbi:hypothetical protein M4R22_20555 [Acidovorax sp. GBBC 3334]|uniref:hypothetical protein n=1 Tax=Acidovorax sp. GBBC 3334 TaxID=2940496 RepID=UPI0023035D75|nr:hypothetical protein [Acidovorax sp. GBBC 3334]MDA8457155.1 hypothetical protein [Acidovorax sp. GBBC 3334]